MCSDARHWPQTDLVWRQFDQFDRVMDRTCVDPVLAAREDRGAAVARARDTCLACLHQERCRALLARGEPAAIMSFCPNAGFFDRCRRRRSGNAKRGA